MTRSVQPGATLAALEMRRRILARMQSCKPELVRNGWVARKNRDGGSFVLRWRTSSPDSGKVQPTIYLGDNETLASAIKRLLTKWRRQAGTLPSERLAVALSLTRRMANELQLHPRARRRLGQLRREARMLSNDKLLFDVLADRTGQWGEFLLYGRSWTHRLRREGLAV